MKGTSFQTRIRGFFNFFIMLSHWRAIIFSSSGIFNHLFALFCARTAYFFFQLFFLRCDREWEIMAKHFVFDADNLRRSLISNGASRCLTSQRIPFLDRKSSSKTIRMLRMRQKCPADQFSRRWRYQWQGCMEDPASKGNSAFYWAFPMWNHLFVFPFITVKRYRASPQTFAGARIPWDVCCKACAWSSPLIFRTVFSLRLRYYPLQK